MAILLTIAILTIGLSMFCGDKGSAPIVNKNLISGMVAIVPDSIGMTEYVEPVPYFEATGRFAELTFTSGRGEAVTTITDENSEFSISLDSDTYTVLVDTDHSWPTNFSNLEIIENGIFNFVIENSFDLIDSVVIIFDYTAPIDQTPFSPLGEISERNFLDVLNNNISNRLNVEGVRRAELDIIATLTGSAVLYTIPITANCRTWEGFAWTSIELRYHSDRYPASMHLGSMIHEYRLDPGNFQFDDSASWNFPDTNVNGTYDPPEPFIGVFPDNYIFDSLIYEWFENPDTIWGSGIIWPDDDSVFTDPEDSLGFDTFWYDDDGVPDFDSL